MPTLSPDLRRRAGGIAFAAVLQSLIAWALIAGLSVHVTPRVVAALKLFEVAAPPPPAPRPVPVRQARRHPSGAAAPPHARATPTAIVTPPPVVHLPPPPPLVVAAPVAALGSDADAGAADRGAGTGAGGEGSGRGSGGGGDGTGSGGTPAEWISGEISGRDYPRAARDAGIEGRLTTRYLIDRRGRVARCDIVVSSGSALLDATTCRLVQQRFRFAPARDGGGRAVEDVQLDDHHWGLRPSPPGEAGGPD